MFFDANYTNSCTGTPEGKSFMFHQTKVFFQYNFLCNINFQFEGVRLELEKVGYSKTFWFTTIQHHHTLYEI